MRFAWAALLAALPIAANAGSLTENSERPSRLLLHSQTQIPMPARGDRPFVFVGESNRLIYVSREAKNHFNLMTGARITADMVLQIWTYEFDQIARRSEESH